MEHTVCHEQTYDVLYRTHFERLRNYVYYKCGDLDKAQDITQESFIQLWKKCADVLLEKVTGFIYTVANNLFLTEVRSQKVALKFEKGQRERPQANDPFFILRTNEFRDKIETAISDLPDGQREVFLMNRIDGLSYKEIAKLLEVSETAIEKRMSKALVKLRDKIEEFKKYKI